MEYRKLGNTNIELSVITYGAFGMGGTMWAGTEKSDSIAAVRASIDNGVTTIDTAPFYGLGLADELIGEAIKGFDRTKLQILTKFGLVWDGSNGKNGEFHFNADHDGQKVPIYKYASKANVIKECEEGLKRMQIDYIDLLQLHWPDNSTPISETMEALELLIQQGKIRAAGVSNYSVAQVIEARQTLNIASNQVTYSMLKRGLEKDLVPYALENDLGILVYSPMERGLLTGKYFKEGKLKDDDHRNRYFKQFNLEKVKTFLDSLAVLAEQKNVSLAQLVLRWTTMQPAITAVLAGARNAEQAIANAKAIDIDITTSDLETINDLHSTIFF